MNLIKISSIVMAGCMIAACGASKKSIKSTTSTATAPTTTSTTTAFATPATIAQPPYGVFSPGHAELAAIQAKYKDVSMQTLADGYTIYTGLCTSCHTAKNIYARPEGAWPGILDIMAIKARITDTQKDAVYKYVLAIKATQPKELK